MLKFIIFSIVSVAFFSLMLNNITLRFANMKLNEELLKSFINYNIVLEKKVSQEAEKIEESDGFLKFVSDSRDWAYAYIESVQEEISSFITIVGPDIEYLESYKPPIISEEATDRLVVGYKKIKALIPEDYGKIDT
jgi:hypothetical protein